MVNVELEAVLQTGRPTDTCGRPCLGGEPTSLPWILSCCHMERYSRGGLDLASCKVGLTDQGVGRPTALLGAPGRASAYRVHMVKS
jgi:hypothetical protein